jgi:rod shape-determining protein MreC
VALSRPGSGSGSGSRTRLTVIVLAAVTVLVIGQRDLPVVRQVREGAATVLSPFEGIAETASRPVRDVWEGVSKYDDVDDLEAENRDLTARVAELEAAQATETDAQRQLEELTATLNLPWVGDIAQVTAKVTSGPRSNFAHAVEVNRGSDDGVKVGMPVVTGGGLVGRVSQVSDDSSTIELITDPEFQVGVRLADTGELGTAQGRGRDEPLVVDTGIEPGAEVADDSALVTSGVDRSAYPDAIPVAKVSDTREASGGLSLELIAEPLVDVDRLTFVDILLWEPPQ